MDETLWPLVVAVAAFVASHLVPATPAVRGRLIRRLGGRGYFLGYGLLSLVLVAMVAVTFRAAPHVEVWPQEPWMRWLPILTMPVASVLILAGMTTPNPFSVGPTGRGFDPARPGLLRLTRHPVLWGMTIWAAPHAVVNGDVAALLLFVPMLALSLLGIPWLEWKRRLALGADFDRLAAATSRPRTFSLMEVGFWRIGLGLVLYAVLTWLHPVLLGVSPLPG
ncbi:MAG: NnrU family protein [Alphaproteobacteria bacterium]|nr:NnrU family protein [Alphaproteobacteria bacterium]